MTTPLDRGAARATGRGVLVVGADSPARSTGSPRPANDPSRLPLAAALAVVCLLPALWPGDAPWVQDEPNLITAALRANAAHRLASVGLYGSFGVAYGPLPTQIYQVLLLLTHDPILLVTVRAVLTMGVTAAALAWMGRTLRMSTWFVPTILLSPFLWMFSRILWDNTFAIPVGALALAAYADFLATQSGRSLLVTIGCALALLSIHFMTAPLVAALGGHLLWRHRRSLWRHRVGVLLVLAVGAASNAGYVATGAARAWDWVGQHGAGAVAPGRADEAAHRPDAPGAIDPASAPAATGDRRPGRVSALLFPLFGGSLFSGDGFYIPHQGPVRPLAAAVAAAAALSRIGLMLVWAGMVVAGLRLVRIWRRGMTVEIRDAVGGVALVALLLQMGMYGVMRVAPYPHYFNGMFAAYALLAWLAVDAIRPPLLRGGLVGVFGLSLAALTACSILSVHRAGGDRGHFGPSLASQIDVARAAARYADGEATTDVPHYRDHPHALWTLRRLLGVEVRPGAARESGRLVIRYRTGQDGRDARDAAVELAEADPPAGGSRVRLRER